MFVIVSMIFFIYYFFFFFFFFFFFNDTATTEIYTLSLHDALPISAAPSSCCIWSRAFHCSSSEKDRKSTRLNSSHVRISYAVFCLKKKKNKNKPTNVSTPQNQPILPCIHISPTHTRYTCMSILSLS